jgi:hypothetical protein
MLILAVMRLGFREYQTAKPEGLVSDIARMPSEHEIHRIVGISSPHELQQTPAELEAKVVFEMDVREIAVSEMQTSS